LWHNADLLAASIEARPTQLMTHEQMIERTAGGAMLGMVVWFERSLALASALLSIWTAVALVRHAEGSSNPTDGSFDATSSSRSATLSSKR